MKTIIAGGRNYRLTLRDYAALDRLHDLGQITEIVSGHASGADADGEFWAKKNNVKFKIFEANWHPWNDERVYKPAGRLRNAKMARYAEACIAFPGCDGTNSMVDIAYNSGLRVYDWRGEKRSLIYVQFIKP